ncbi:hypothetical protein ACWERW_34500 [Streptomyces sp. NPDC004012]
MVVKGVSPAPRPGALRPDRSAFIDNFTEAASRGKPVHVFVGGQDRAIDPSLERYEAEHAHKSHGGVQEAPPSMKPSAGRSHSS